MTEKENVYRDPSQIEKERQALKRIGGFLCGCGEPAHRKVKIFDPTEDGIGTLAIEINLCAKCEDDEGFSNDNNRFGQNDVNQVA